MLSATSVARAMLWKLSPAISPSCPLDPDANFHVSAGPPRSQLQDKMNGASILLSLWERMGRGIGKGREKISIHANLTLNEGERKESLLEVFQTSVWYKKGSASPKESPQAKVGHQKRSMSSKKCLSVPGWSTLEPPTWGQQQGSVTPMKFDVYEIHPRATTGSQSSVPKMNVLPRDIKFWESRSVNYKCSYNS